MTREQAEANWIWHPEHGDLRPPSWPKNRRLPCTQSNIDAQQSLARPGTLIHTAAKTNCPRKKSKVDERTESYAVAKQARRMSDLALSEGKITFLAVASFIGNVNCLWCRRDYFAGTGKPIIVNAKEIVNGKRKSV